MRLNIRAALRTDVGMVRSVNEDAALMRNADALWLVADGLGGHDHGDWAAQTLVHTLSELALAGDMAQRSGQIAAALAAGNAVIHRVASAAGGQMGTTAVVLHLVGDRLLCGWVGDSRAYRLRQHLLQQLTHDHSVVQEMVDKGLVSVDDAETHPLAHMLSRAIGTAAEVQVDFVEDQVRPGDLFLLCSDGLTKVFSDEEIARLLVGSSPETVADRLVRDTLARGAPDNVTVIVLLVEETTELMQEEA
jgi:serine/threonine protein phosphatase PrpC